MSKYGVFSGPYFPVFGQDTGEYGPEETPYWDTFHAVNLFKHLKVFQIIGIALATERSIKSVTFIFLGFCLNFKSTFTIKKFMNDFWNDFWRAPHDGCFW